MHCEPQGLSKKVDCVSVKAATWQDQMTSRQSALYSRCNALLHAEFIYAKQKQHVLLRILLNEANPTQANTVWQSLNMLQVYKKAHPISIGPINLCSIRIQGDSSRHESGVIRRIRRLPDQSRCSQSRSHCGCQIGSPHIIPCSVVGPVQGVVLRPAPVVLVSGVVTHLHAFIHTFSI